MASTPRSIFQIPSPTTTFPDTTFRSYPTIFGAFKVARFQATRPASDLQAHALEAMSPIAMTKYALEQTRAQLQVCTLFFGRAPYDNIEITEQPNFSFGQSWPNLVYLPISAYIDSTQRWMLFGHIDTNFTGFVQEVT